MDDIIGDLERLTKLRDAGALTEAEFESQKARLLGTGRQPPQASTCQSCGAPLQLDAAGRCIYCQHLHVGAAPAGAVASPTGSSDASDDAIARAYPDKEIMAIKELRAATGVGLKEAKDRIEAAYRRLGIKK